MGRLLPHEEMTYRILWAPSARRQLENRIPDKVGAAVWEFVDGPLTCEPYRVGKTLRYELEGFHSARRGDYRVIYSIQGDTVHIVRVEHRGTAYQGSFSGS